MHKGLYFHIVFLFFLVFAQFNILAQGTWQYASLSPLPVPLAHNAVVEGALGNQKLVYSFGGCSDSLTIADCTKKVFRYQINTNQWSETAEMPDSLPVVGHRASHVQNRIFVIGGEVIDENIQMIKQDVRIYNIFLDTFENNGANMPYPVTEHVQSVWRDSLIFVFGGWNGTEISNKIQVYNPFFNAWSVIGEMPSGNAFNVYGAGGYISGDTICIIGGISSQAGFQPNVVRKGRILDENGLTVNWEAPFTTFEGTKYRPVVSGHGNTVFSFAGNEEEYDLTGNNSLGQVFPQTNRENFRFPNNQFQRFADVPFATMGLGGIAKLGGGNWLLTGGIDSTGVAMSDVWLLTNFALSDMEFALQPPFFEVNELPDFFRVITENVGQISVYDSAGRRLFRQRKQLADILIPKHQLQSNFLIFVYDDGSNVPVTIKRIHIY
jgi:N-acetylneuraminic acid mutarotase